MAASEAQENYLYDFLYVNHDILSSYNAQLDNDGLLTSSVVTHQTSEQITNSVSGDIKVIKGQREESSHFHSTRQNNFDTSKNMPLNVIRELNSRGLIHNDISTAQLGQIVLFSGRMQLVDLAMMSDLIIPSLDVYIDDPSSGEAERARQVKNSSYVKLIRAMPRVLQIRIFDDEKSAWCTVEPKDMVQNTFSLAMKYDVTIHGEWHMLAVLDAFPDDKAIDNKAFEYMSQFDMNYIETFLSIRQLIGRRPTEYGLTPLAIFRKLT